ncbi:hypothetical protein [uncultured Psychroserpens sp.]|uniref:hypothetical protein n=1 Tax=uncultured Psychroserpens sp. TaxID=255436 RepID=UPI002619F011|nr:hypothetical protein [uncultured Psychroserpens sp.]
MNNNLNIIILSLLVVSLFFSCKTENKKSSESKKGFYSIKAVGKKKDASYTFCGAVGTEVNYSYRIGTWTFKTKDNIKIAEGEYDTVIKVSDSTSGSGCEFTYVENTTDPEKWRFWNKDGQIIEPTNRLINLIESNQEEHSFYLE